MTPKQKTTDPEGYVLGRHDYDKGTILWAHRTDGWHKLRGPLADDPSTRAAAVAWAGG